MSAAPFFFEFPVNLFTFPYLYREPKKTEFMYQQLCVLQGITDSLSDLKSLIETDFGVRIRMADEFETIADDDGPGGRRDVLFYIHHDDVMKFAVPRLQVGIRWFEDVLGNGAKNLPEWVLEKYTNTWKA